MAGLYDVVSRSTTQANQFFSDALGSMSICRELYVLGLKPQEVVEHLVDRLTCDQHRVDRGDVAIVFVLCFRYFPNPDRIPFLKQYVFDLPLRGGNPYPRAKTGAAKKLDYRLMHAKPIIDQLFASVSQQFARAIL